MVELEEFRKSDLNRKLDIIAEQIIELSKEINTLAETLQEFEKSKRLMYQQLLEKTESFTSVIKSLQGIDEKILIKRILSGDNRVLDYIKRRWHAYVV